MDRFGDRCFVPTTPELLDHEGAELVLIAAGHSVEEEDLELDTERETETTAEQLFKELEMEPDHRPTEPPTRGEWR